MVLESLAAASLVIGTTSTVAGTREFLAQQRRNAQDHLQTEVRLSQQSVQGRPCVKCDWSTLRHLNSTAYKESCVSVSFEMPSCCPRCRTFKENLINRYAPSFVSESLVEYTKVRVRVPVETYGVIQRAAEASAVGEKGSKFRATGSFVSHIVGRRNPAVDKIAEMKWFPYILERAFTNRAKVELPGVAGRYDGYLSTEEYSDYGSIPGDIKTVRTRAETVLRRLRKLKKDEYLTDVARQICRLKKDETLKKIEELMRLHDTDSIFAMDLVRLAPLKIEEIKVAAPSSEDICQWREAAVSPDAAELSTSDDGRNQTHITTPAFLIPGEPSDDEQLTIATEPVPTIDKFRRLRRKANRTIERFEAGKQLGNRQKDWVEKAQQETGMITRDALLRLKTNDYIDLGFKVGKPKALRRAKRVAERA